MVFIIDELDRCRPTFAIELLERVKHIFDVQNMVFVFGIDRNELGKSIQSVYGSINVDGYLRRFFDMDFELPAPDYKIFVNHIIDKHYLEEYFRLRGEQSKKEYSQLKQFVHLLSKHFSLSLRDIEHCIRLLVFVSKQIDGSVPMFPKLLGLLIVLRLKESQLYTQYVSGDIKPAELLDRIDGFVEMLDDSPGVEHSVYFECGVYTTGMDQIDHREDSDMVVVELAELMEADGTQYPEHLSKRTQSLSESDRQEFYKIYQREKIQPAMGREFPTHQTLMYLSNLIELVPIPKDHL